jgi:hypothetical protein
MQLLSRVPGLRAVEDVRVKWNRDDDNVVSAYVNFSDADENAHNYLRNTGLVGLPRHKHD